VTTTLTYSPRQWLLTSTLSTGAAPLTTALTYDAVGNLVKTMLPDGSALTNSYDAAHRLIGITDLFEQSTSFTLDANGDRTETDILNSANAAQRKHSATFDALSRLLHDIGGVGQTTAYTYDANGNALTVTDPLAHVTKQAFDPLNRLIRSTDAAGGASTITYDAHDRPLTVLDSNGGLTSFVYDGFGDVVQRISPDTGTTIYRYDLAGNLTQSVDATGATADYTYDVLNRPLTATYPADAAENVTFVYDEAGHGFGIGRLTSVTDAGGTLSRSYDERGNVLSERRTHGTATLLTSTAFDAASRIASITYPSGWKVAYTRDVMGRATGIAAQPPGGGAPKPVVSGVAYQPFGPVNALAYGNGVAEMRSFDPDYRLLNLTDTGTAAFQNLTYSYDAANNVSKIANGVTAANTQNLGYDALDHLTSATGNYGSLGYTYSAIGNRLTQTSGGAVTNYTYTLDSNRLAAISIPASSAPSAMTFSVSGSIESNPGLNWPSGTVTGTITAGSCTSATLGQKCTIASINVTDSYSGITITNPGNSSLYLYAAGNGNASGQWGISPNITSGAFILGGVFQNSPGQPNSGWVYQTGSNGNTYAGLYSITPLPSGPSVVTQSIDTTAAGNVASFTPAFGTVTNLTYNQANRLATVSGASGQLAQYTYDALGRRVVKVGASTATTLYPYDSAGHLLEDNDGLGTSRVDYVYLDDRPVATIQPSVGQVYFLHDDRLGTPQLATDANQTVQWTATYQPFGYTSTAVGLIVHDLRMPGQEFDLETGLYHNGFRDYVPALGRYVESDPIGLDGGTNAFVYVRSNPIKQTDRRGLDNIFVFGG
jgi:RHS repeat-associated protein